MWEGMEGERGGERDGERDLIANEPLGWCIPATVVVGFWGGVEVCGKVDRTSPGVMGAPCPDARLVSVPESCPTTGTFPFCHQLV